MEQLGDEQWGAGPGQPGIAGVTLYLNGLDDRANSVNASTTTGSTGAYSFTGLRPGTYTVTDSQPAGYLPGKVVAGSEPNVSIVQPTLHGAMGQITLSVDPGDNDTGNNFAELLPASLSGYVFDNLNNNGVMQAGDPTIAGASVTLTGTSDLGAITPLSFTSNSAGGFSFSSLRPGVYACR